MRFINRGRGTGKTVMLIHTSYVTGYPIVVNDFTMKDYVLSMAKKMNCDVDVLTLRDFQNIKGFKVFDKILLDESKGIIDKALNEYFGCEVVAGTMSVPMFEN